MQQVILQFNYTLELLEHVVNRSSGTCTLIICASRDDFLSQIVPPILKPHAQEIPASQESDPEDEPTEKPTPHPFLSPTLRLISTTDKIRLVFCPSINSLRAFLGTCSSNRISPAQPSTPTVSPESPTLWILDLVLLHHATSEFSVQGLMRTFAVAVEAAARLRANLKLVECKDIHDPQNPDRGQRLWGAEVPLLSGSVRIGGERPAWVGRAVSVQRVAERWFEVVNPPRMTQYETVDEYAEMLV